MEEQKLTAELEDSLGEFFKNYSLFNERESKKPPMYPFMVHASMLDESVGVVNTGVRANAVGSFVAIRPCAKEYGNKTYLGIYIGDIAMGVTTKRVQSTSDPSKGAISIGFGAHNPAIFVPELKQIIFGCASWWNIIKKPEDLKDITDDLVESQWYVKAAKQMFQEEVNTNVECNSKDESGS